MTIAVRRGTLADLPEVAALEVDNLGPDPWPESLLAEGLADRLPTVHYLLATVVSEHTDLVDLVVGYAVVSVAADVVAELQRIAVTSAHRRLGVATALLAAVADLACEGGAERLLLEVREGNAGALGFYTASGFAEIHRRPRYYRDGSGALVLQRHLAP